VWRGGGEELGRGAEVFVGGDHGTLNGTGSRPGSFKVPGEGAAKLEGVPRTACTLVAEMDGGVSAIGRRDYGFDDTLPGAAAWIRHLGRGVRR
jgi:hypothetical protein